MSFADLFLFQRQDLEMRRNREIFHQPAHFLDDLYSWGWGRPVRNQELTFEYVMWGAGDQVLVHLLLPFPERLAGTWIESRITGTSTRSHMMLEVVVLPLCHNVIPLFSTSGSIATAGELNFSSDFTSDIYFHFNSNIWGLKFQLMSH